MSYDAAAAGDAAIGRARRPRAPASRLSLLLPKSRREYVAWGFVSIVMARRASIYSRGT